MPDLDGAVQRTIDGIIGIINLIAGPYLIVITSKTLVGDIHGQKIYKIQKIDMIPYARNMSHLNESQVRNSFRSI
jgi:phosphatidylinositol 4-phosphatase